ncbi:MAG: hypothetical protein ACO3EG_02775 [Chitinophagaceae bacterium]
MEFEKIHNKGQARLFKSDFLEALTKSHPLVIWGMYIPVMAFLVIRAAERYHFTSLTLTLVFL